MRSRIAAPDLSVDRRRIKWSYATQVLADPPGNAASLSGRLEWRLADAPRPDDVIVAEVLEIGRHTRIELQSKRRATLFPNDLLGLSYGHRYATEQFEGVVPPTTAVCHMLTVAGVCGEVRGAPDDMDSPTTVRPLGYLVDPDGSRVNLRDYGLRPAETVSTGQARTVLVLGSSMDAGKSTVAASLINGLTRSGAVVCAAKLTGTASARDLLLMEDAGAARVLDFTDVGHASTAMCERDDLWNIVKTVRSHFADLSPDYVVFEVADGLVQKETAQLIELFHRNRCVDATIYACRDSLSVAAGVQRLRCFDLNVAAVSGLITYTPLSTREAQAETDLPVLRLDDLRDPTALSRLFPTSASPPADSAFKDTRLRKDSIASG